MTDTDRPLFRDMDENDESRDPQSDVTDNGPIVGGMGQLPGSGSTGIASGGMAPPISAGAANRAVDDLTEESSTEEPLPPEAPLADDEDRTLT